MTVGIYCITSKIDNKRYIGQALNIEERWIYHKRDLKANKHHSKHLQNAWNKYGEQNFEFSILEEVDLVSREQYWMDYYNTLNKKYGYNIKGAGPKGVVSEDTKQKLRIINTGKTVSEETKKKMSNANYGEKNSANKYSEELIKKAINMMLDGYKTSYISKELNIHKSILREIKNGRSWRYLTQNLVFPSATKPNKIIGITNCNGRFRVRLVYKNKMYYLGTYDLFLDAFMAYNNKAKELGKAQQYIC